MVISLGGFTCVCEILCVCCVPRVTRVNRMRLSFITECTSPPYVRMLLLINYGDADVLISRRDARFVITPHPAFASLDYSTKHRNFESRN